MIARAVVLALFWLAVLSGATGAFAQSQPLSEAGYSRDQATVRELRIWNGRMAVQIVGRGWTELARADGKPIAATTKLLNTDIALQAITLPVEEHFVETMDVVDDTGRTWALVRTHFGLALWHKQPGGYWQPVTVPDMIRTSSHRLTVIPTGTLRPLLLGDGALYFDSAAKRNQGLDDSWDVSKYPPEPRHITLGNMGPQPRHTAYSRGQLYLGYDAKWREGPGVGLYRLDIDKGEWINLLPWDRQMPVVSLTTSPSGAVWAATGDMQGTTRRGEIYDLGTGKTFAAMDSMSMTRTDNWDLDPAAPMDMAVDARGRILLLTGEYGVVRSTGRSGFGEARWERLTAAPLWDQYTFVTALLLIGERYALIGTVDMGLLVWDLQSQVHWRVRTWQ